MSSRRSTCCISVGKNAIPNCADVYDGTSRMLKMQKCITRTPVQMVTAELRYECITRSFLIDECRITEFGYIVNIVKDVARHDTCRQRAVRSLSQGKAF
ncbi:hypothetical protein TNCV_4976201 [Trichonephila clavipes]|nr:hypothetical protein TNCV_4976201 [Trichonephila clavipes]